MATYKRRVIYLSDEEWLLVERRAKALGMTFSAYMRGLINWRQPEAGTARDPFREFRPVPKGK